MKNTLTALLLIAGFSACSQADLKSSLLQQLKSTHNNKEWFVPANTAIEGLTAEQASWKDGSGNHSAGQLTHHLVFWNERALLELSGKKPTNFSGKNDETFDSFDKKTWDDLVKRLDAVKTGLEKLVHDADEPTLKKIAPTIGNICTHNAYHTGQIIFVRKLQGSWDVKNGVN